MIKSKIKYYQEALPAATALVAVSKFHPVEQVQEAYEAGQRVFGESHAQELVVKAPQMPGDIQWHFIGHLQRNKVRAILPVVAMIHSVDSLRLLDTIDKEAERLGRVVDILLQLHVAQEEAKSGFAVDELLDLARRGAFEGYKHVRFRGLMAMATFTDNQAQIAREFASVQATFGTLRDEGLFDASTFTEISMGMSDDWQIAVKYGATLVRIGTDIFGARNY